jgi:TctA family transporter
MSGGSSLIFFTRPIALAFVCSAAAVILFPVFRRLLRFRKMATGD